LSTGQGHKERKEEPVLRKNIFSKGFYVCKRKVLGGEKGKK
jgi:hypothetical protein